jgi:hypothetical protein
MKTRYLRRFRKTYSWHYDRERNNWVLFNKKTMKKMRRKESFIIIAPMLNAYFSLGQIISYIKRKERILDKKENS